MSPKALIIGGGVAGPAVGLFLRRIGWDAEIYEAGAEPDDYAGSFLNVATNGLAVLDTLGLRDRLLTDAYPCPKMIMWSGRGKQLGVVPNGPAGEPARGSVVVQRGWLQRVIREEAQAGGVPVHFGKRLTTITQLDGGVRATFEDGTTAEGEILIGADGINSPTRRHIDPDAPDPAYAGIVAVGGYARTPAAPPLAGTQHMIFGRRSFFGHLTRADGTVYWFANITRPEPARGELRDTSTEQWLELLTRLHHDDPSPVPEILAAHTGEVRGYSVYDLHHVTRWSRGSVVALGDAVHATSPSAGQGTSLALEDTIVLARCMRDEATLAEAFAAFQQIRQRRVEQVVGYAQEITKRKTISSNPVAVRMRDAMLPIFLRKAASDTRLNWLYDHQIPWVTAERPNRMAG